MSPYDLPLRVELHVEGENRHVAFINQLDADARWLTAVHVGDRICLRETSPLCVLHVHEENRLKPGCYSVVRRVWDFFDSEESPAGSAYLSIYLQPIPV